MYMYTRRLLVFYKASAQRQQHPRDSPLYIYRHMTEDYYQETESISIGMREQFFLPRPLNAATHAHNVRMRISADRAPAE